MALTIDVNTSCPLECRFCYQECKKSSLNRDEIIAIARANSKFDRVELGGGEPLMHPQIISIIQALRTMGREVHVSTSATYLPPGLLTLEDGIKNGTEIQISLPASNRTLYQRVTGKNLFDEVLVNLTRIKSKFRVTGSTVVYEENYADVEGIVNLFKNLGIALRINLAFPYGQGRKVNLLNQNQIRNLRNFILIEKALYGTRIDSPIIHPNICQAIERAYGLKKQGKCPAETGGKKYISPDGKAYKCEFLLEEAKN